MRADASFAFARIEAHDWADQRHSPGRAARGLYDGCRMFLDAFDASNG
jgi:hypothetical protein